MRWRCQFSRPIGARQRDLLGLFSAFSRRGPPSDPDMRDSKRCSDEQRYTRLHGFVATAAPICFRVHADPRLLCFFPSDSCRSDTLTPAPGASRHFGRSIQMRPASTAGPPNLSVGSRQLLRAVMPLCVTKRGPEFAPEMHPRAILTKSQSTHESTQLSCFTAVLCVRRSLAGPSSVIKPTQRRRARANLKHIDGDEAWPEVPSAAVCFRVRSAICF
jgi:hypothetical protein